ITFGGTLAGSDQPQITASGSNGATATSGTAVEGLISRLAISGNVQDPAGVPASFKAAEFHKVGDGVIALPNANTYQGLTVVEDGVLNIRNDGSLGAATAGTVVNTGATLQTEGGFVETDEPLTLVGGGERGQGALANTLGDNVWGSTITLGDNNVAIGANADTLFITGQITEGAKTLGVTKVGPATVEFTGTADNKITGVTKVGAGTLI